MTELEKYELINKCNTVKELQEAIKQLDEGGFIRGRTNYFSTTQQIEDVEYVIGGGDPTMLTRNYGIRQQALCIKYYHIK